MTRVVNVFNLDMDGVIVDLDSEFERLCQVHLGLEGKLADCSWERRWKMWEDLGDNRKDMFLHAKPFNYADQLVKEILTFCDNAGYKLSILTALPHAGHIAMAEEDKREWLDRYLPELSNHRFKLGPYSGDKWKHCLNKNDILLDDSSSNVFDWNIKGNGRGILHKNIPLSISIIKELNTNIQE